MANMFGLTDNQIAGLMLIFAVFYTVQTALENLPEEEQPPGYVMTVLAIAASSILVIQGKLGVATASTAKVAKFTDPGLQQTRKVEGTTAP
jgi:hypothetical protein